MESEGTQIATIVLKKKKLEVSCFLISKPIIKLE